MRKSMTPTSFAPWLRRDNLPVAHEKQGGSPGRSVQDSPTGLPRYAWSLFLSILVGLLTVATQKTLSSLAQAHSISALSRFLNCYRWPASLLRHFRQQLITKEIHKRYLRKRGRPPIIYLIIDDTVIPKRGRHFPGWGLHYSVTQKQVTPGHDLVFAFLVVSTSRAPWAWRLYRNRRFDPQAYRKKVLC